MRWTRWIVVAVLAAAATALAVWATHRRQPEAPQPRAAPPAVVHPRSHARAAPPPAVAELAWPTYGYDDMRDRAVAAAKLAPPFRRLWTFHGHALLEFPPVVANDHVFIPNFQGHLYALAAATGRPLWRYASGRCGWASPAFDQNRVFVTFIGSSECGSHYDDGELVAFDAATGHTLWTRRLAPTESSPLVLDGRVYIGDWNGGVDAFAAATGRELWRFSGDGAIKGSVAAADGLLYIGTYAGDLYALDAGSGHEVWSSSGGGSYYSSPAVAGGRVFIGSLDDRVKAFSAAHGSRLWSTATGGYVYASPAVENGMVFIGSYDHYFYALDAATGAIRWRYHATGPISGAASVIGDTVYFSSFDERTYALDVRDGHLLETWPDGKYSPAVTDGRRLYLVGLGRLYALVPR